MKPQEPMLEFNPRSSPGDLAFAEVLEVLAVHPTPEALVAYALGEDQLPGLADEVSSHISGCALCRDDAAAVASDLGALGTGVPPEKASPMVWRLSVAATVGAFLLSGAIAVGAGLSALGPIAAELSPKADSGSAVQGAPLAVSTLDFEDGSLGDWVAIASDA